MSAALDFWRDKVWCAADSVGIKLTDEQLEAITINIAEAAPRAPDPEVVSFNARTEG